MVSHGRAPAVAAAWIVVPSVAAAVAAGIVAARSDGPWGGLVIVFAINGLVVLTPLALLAAAIWIARRARRAARRPDSAHRAGSSVWSWSACVWGRLHRRPPAIATGGASGCSPATWWRCARVRRRRRGAGGAAAPRRW